MCVCVFVCNGVCIASTPHYSILGDENFGIIHWCHAFHERKIEEIVFFLVVNSIFWCRYFATECKNRRPSFIELFFEVLLIREKLLKLNNEWEREREQRKEEAPVGTVFREGEMQKGEMRVTSFLMMD